MMTSEFARHFPESQNRVVGRSKNEALLPLCDASVSQRQCSGGGQLRDA